MRVACILLLFALTAAFPAEAPSAAGKPGLVVVAPARFQAAMGEYIVHRKAQLPVELAALENVIRSTEGADDPERLKRWLHAAWRERGAAYALLVGDADVLPVRYMVLDRITAQAFDYAFYPSDLYYGDLARQDGSFDDWNGRKEGFHAGYHGEVRGEKNKQDPINFDGIDYLPEIAVGRWPASTPEEVSRIAAKTIAYEKGLASGRKPGARRAAFISVDGWVDSRGVLDRMGGYLGPAWRIEKRYYAGGGRNDGTPPPDSAQVISLLNEGLGLLCHAGHGQDDRWEQSLKLSHLARVSNSDRLPVVVSAGCSTARFAALPPYEGYLDVAGREHPGTTAGEVFSEPPPPPAPYQSGKFNPRGLGEELLRAGPGGAVAYFGCNTGSQPCGLTLVRGFVKGFREAPGRRLGDAWKFGIAYYHERERLAELEPTADWYPPSIFFQGMKFMLFGDPALLLPDAAPEREL